jgi:enoyl-CoA hydratase
MDAVQVPVSVEIIDGGVGVISIDRPDRRNAVNMAVKGAIIAAIEAFSQDERVGAIILTGKGGYFAAGSDVTEMAAKSSAEMKATQGEQVFAALRNCPKPVVAAVEGYALGGGCELALSCDMIVAAENAQFGQPEINLGIMPGAGGTQLLLRTLGKYRAFRMILTGERIDAATAAGYGLVSEISPPGEALARAVELARKIAAKSRPAVRVVKEAMVLGQETSLSVGLAFERQGFLLLFDTPEQKAGMRRFVE